MALQMSEHDPHVLAFAKQVLNFGAEATMAEAMANEQSQSAALREVRARKTKQS